MKNLVFVFSALLMLACAEESVQKSTDSSGNLQTQSMQSEKTTDTGRAGNLPEESKAETSIANSAESQTVQPKTVRDFFMLLPEKYFVLESCEKTTDKDCKRAKVEYLKSFAEIEDTKNGYLKGGCDGAQSCLEMAIFKRPDGTYLVGLGTFAEMMNDYYFFDYKNGKWTDVSAQVVPEYSRKNMYEFPRFGTTVKVYAKKIIEQTNDYEISERGAKLYDLEWKDGKFTKKK